MHYVHARQQSNVGALRLLFSVHQWPVCTPHNDPRSGVCILVRLEAWSVHHWRKATRTCRQHQPPSINGYYGQVQFDTPCVNIAHCLFMYWIYVMPVYAIQLNQLCVDSTIVSSSCMNIYVFVFIVCREICYFSTNDDSLLTMKPRRIHHKAAFRCLTSSFSHKRL